MKSTTKAPAAYPHIRDQPSYREAMGKLSYFRAQLQIEQQKLHALQAEYAASINSDERREPEIEHVIEKAEALIAGTAPLQSLIDQIQTKTRLIKALEDAARAQSGIVTDVERALSREAGQHFLAEHKAVVARLVAAVEELHAANLAEVEFRNGLDRLGYYGALRAMQFDQVAELDPDNRMGCRAHFWAREVRPYIA
ncbi:hypothetical protein [Massilia sp. YMA4]|uniref:hypothetical protein n=1 Tax=Massilia sp. YMA4 TaxID=1593482 RepID=UPI000DD13736|nr:hypothetical protein [Massilia sp. YMA4]AXA93572.1 hypothetical protein DPH57_21940 [Massilia sp. YMA4]